MAYQNILKEQDKGVIYTDDPKKAKDLADKGSNVKLTNEAPDDMYYIKVKKDDVNILDNILTTFLDLKVQYNDDKEGTFFYFTKDSWAEYEKLALQYIEDQRLTDDILDTNIPSLGGDTLEEESQLKFSREELTAIAREVGKAVAKAAIEAGDEIKSAKIKDIYTSAVSPSTPQLFTVHVIYKNDNEETYRFEIREDSVFLIDQSYDREIADVGVKPSGEAIVNIDIVKNEMLKYFKSLNEMLPHKDIKPGSPEDHENKAFDQLTDDEKQKVNKILKMLSKNEGKPMGFGTGQGRSKTISKGRETRPDLKAKLATDLPHKGKYVMIKGVPHKSKDGKLVPLTKVAEDALGFSDIEKLGSKAASDIDTSVRRDPDDTFGNSPNIDDKLRYKHAKQLGYLNEEQPTVFDDESMDALLQIILKYVKDPKDAEKELDMLDYGGYDAMSPEVMANLERDPEFKKWYDNLHSAADTDYTQRRREEDDYYDADQAQKDDEEDYERGYDDDGLPLGEEADTSELDVYGYQTKHFDICPGATKLFKDIIAGEYTDGVPSVPEQEKLIQLAKLHDVLFAIEKVALKDSDKAKKHLQHAINIASDIYELGAEIGLDSNHRGEDLYYIEDHIKKINDAARGEETDEGKYKSDAQRKAIYATKAEKGELDEVDAMSMADILANAIAFGASGAGLYKLTKLLADPNTGDITKDSLLKALKKMKNEELDEVRGTSYFLKTYIQPAIDELVSDGDIDESEAVIELLEHIADSYGVEIQIGGATNDSSQEGLREDLDVGHQDDEPGMLKSTAYESATYAAKLYKKLAKYDQFDGEVDFPNWWQSKLILAKDYLAKAFHYLDSEEKQPIIDKLALEESVQEGKELDKVLDDIKKVKLLAPSMNKLPQDDPKRKAFIEKVKKLNIKKKELMDKEDDRVSNIGKGQELQGDE